MRLPSSGAGNGSNGASDCERAFDPVSLPPRLPVGGTEERLGDWHRMLNDESIDAIICRRGGYGTPRLLE